MFSSALIQDDSNSMFTIQISKNVKDTKPVKWGQN